jgi:hypothetical protein
MRSYVNIGNMSAYSVVDAKLDNPHLPTRDVIRLWRLSRHVDELARDDLGLRPKPLQLTARDRRRPLRSLIAARRRHDRPCVA